MGNKLASPAGAVAFNGHGSNITNIRLPYLERSALADKLNVLAEDARFVGALVGQREAESVRSAPVIIINSSGDDDANSGDEDNTRMRGNHRSS